MALTRAPTIPFSPAWTSIHLLAASATFAVPFLSNDGEGSSPTSAMSGIWPRENLDWFAHKIFDVLEVLDSFDSAGNYASKICRQLLFGLCTSRKELQDRFVQRQSALANAASSQSTLSLEQLAASLTSTAAGAGDAPLLDFAAPPNEQHNSFLNTLIMDPQEWNNLTMGLAFENSPV